MKPMKGLNFVQYNSIIPSLPRVVRLNRASSRRWRCNRTSSGGRVYCPYKRIQACAFIIINMGGTCCAQAKVAESQKFVRFFRIIYVHAACEFLGFHLRNKS